MTSATPKPRAGEQTPSNTPETDAHERWLREEGSSSDYLPELVTADFARALEAERDLLRERERELVEVLRALTQVGTIDGNVVVGPRGWQMMQTLLAKHGR